MADLILSGPLNMVGMLTLKPEGGKVLLKDKEALVELIAPSDPPHCETAPPVILPPPPATPLDTGTKVWVINSFNKTVKVSCATGEKAVVTQGIVMQGTIPTWPGMVLPSQGNAAGPVTVNHIPINVLNDKAIIFPSGGTAILNASGQ